MADLFSVTSPLLIKSPYGGAKIIAELFPHPRGIVFLEIFWNELRDNQGFHFIEGEVQGIGPWKLAGYVINLLGCHGANPELAQDYSQWQIYRQAVTNEYPDIETIENMVAAFIQQQT